MKKLIQKYRTWRRNRQKEMISTIIYKLPCCSIQCYAYSGNAIQPFCGELTKELWDEMRPYLHIDDASFNTVIHIYDCTNENMITYSGTIETYLRYPSLLKLKT